MNDTNLRIGTQYEPKTFENFLEILVQLAGVYGFEGLHTHWRPINLLCSPCKVKYENFNFVFFFSTH